MSGKPTTPEERAADVCFRKRTGSTLHPPDSLDCPECRPIAEAIRSAIAEARREERKECARVAANIEVRLPDPRLLDPEQFYIEPERLSEKIGGYKADMCNQIAAAILARKDDDA